MKISVKQGRLMAFMVAMVLIVGIFIIGKMLGYGSAKNLYLLEGYDLVEGNTDDEDGDDAQGDDKDDEEEIGAEPFKENKSRKDHILPKPIKKDVEDSEEKKEVKDPEPRMSNSNGSLITQGPEKFTCGKNKLLTSSVSGYDESESKLTPF